MHVDESSSVVIYGGGVAGAVLAKELSRHIDVTLVEPLSYFEVPMAIPRCLVNPEFSNRSIIPFEEALPGVRHIRSRLVELLPTVGGIVADEAGNEHVVSGQISVLATGSRFATQLPRSLGGGSCQRQEFYRLYSHRIAKANRILIVGGGPVGVEIAGEITEHHPNKTIHLLESGPRLLRGTSGAAAAHADHVLRERGVDILLNERLLSATSEPYDALAEGGEAETSKGRRIPYDLLIWCIGGIPNTGYLRKHHSALLNRSGQVCVQPTLQVVGHPRLFALGDITDLKENKMAWHIEGHVHVAKANILSLLGGNNTHDSLKCYKPRTRNPMMVVTLGSEAGVMHLPYWGTIRSAHFNRIVKSNDMLTQKFRKILLR